MTRHRHIASEVKTSVRNTHKPSPILLSLLQELHTRLRKLQNNGQTYCIDIHSLPMLQSDHDLLVKILGKGEVGALVNAMGPTRIREAGIPGVWWVVNYNIRNEVISELLEITTIPDLLRTHPQELTSAIDILQSRIIASNEPSRK